jgi:hypothetical protein
MYRSALSDLSLSCDRARKHIGKIEESGDMMTASESLDSLPATISCLTNYIAFDF